MPEAVARCQLPPSSPRWRRRPCRFPAATPRTAGTICQDRGAPRRPACARPSALPFRRRPAGSGDLHPVAGDPHTAHCCAATIPGRHGSNRGPRPGRWVHCAAQPAVPFSADPTRPVPRSGARSHGRTADKRSERPDRLPAIRPGGTCPSTSWSRTRDSCAWRMLPRVRGRRCSTVSWLSTSLAPTSALASWSQISMTRSTLRPISAPIWGSCTTALLPGCPAARRCCPRTGGMTRRSPQLTWVTGTV